MCIRDSPGTAAPGEQWAYNNSAFVLLSVLAGRAAGRSYYDLVRPLVCERAGLQPT